MVYDTVLNKVTINAKSAKGRNNTKKMESEFIGQ